MRDEMMRMRMMRITRKRRMRTMDNKHNDGDDDNKAIIRKQGRVMRTWDEDKGQR